MDYCQHGWLTKAHFDLRTSAAGFFPIVSVTSARVFEGLGGCQQLHSLSTERALESIRSIENIEKAFAGVEPNLTEMTVTASLKFIEEHPKGKRPRDFRKQDQDDPRQDRRSNNQGYTPRKRQADHSPQRSRGYYTRSFFNKKYRKRDE